MMIMMTIMMMIMVIMMMIMIIIMMIMMIMKKNLRAESKSETGLETLAVAEEGVVVVLGWIGGRPGPGGGLHNVHQGDIQGCGDSGTS